ncbi:hypothetical protein BGZ63DRAFT_430891 [Mariannaea sp. PMI_226]|nr:hypothetical protein BGZ63DRAFT_430891 [Mariannaea sp. PMI_226]
MADNAESSGDAQITFKVKTSSDGAHTITMSEAASVLDLKTKLATAEFENIPVEQQRLIYSGRVMKNDDALSAYKIKHNNTIHMVKSAASNNQQPSRPASSTRSAPQAVPTNMASGTANNPLAGLTGARYAGHQINLPGLDMFGPDGGMGPPMDEERIQRLMSDPNVQQSMNEALNNPDFVNMLIESNPMLRNIPNAREIITSPFMRQMMSNPSMMSQAMRMQRNMARGGGFPAPGATNTPDAAAPEGTATGGNDGNDNNNNNNNNNSRNTPDQQGASNPPPNPFAQLFGGANMPNQAGMGMNPEVMRQVMEMMRGGAPGAAAPVDNRPPEERYAEQLRQLNDMGFYDFDRNVAALRRSGGSVQGAIEHLLGGN